MQFTNHELWWNGQIDFSSVWNGKVEGDWLLPDPEIAWQVNHLSWMFAWIGVVLTLAKLHSREALARLWRSDQSESRSYPLRVPCSCSHHSAPSPAGNPPQTAKHLPWILALGLTRESPQTWPVVALTLRESLVHVFCVLPLCFTKVFLCLKEIERDYA